MKMFRCRKVQTCVIFIPDPNYIDPLGPQMERPKTAAKRHNLDDEFADEELGEDLLPE